jgi:pimeloyl-ACP methyl ester carboxylesterase
VSKLFLLDVDQAQIEVLDIAAGNINAPTLVLLHEGLGCVAMWKDFPQALAHATGARIVAYSRVGYGQSTPHAAGQRHVYAVDYQHREAQAFLPTLLRALRVDRPVLIGHSDGATIALIYAAAFAQAVRGVCVMAPHLFVEDISVRSIALAKRQFEESPKLRDRLAKYHRDPTAMFYGWNDIWLSPAFRTMDITPMMRQLVCPVLAIQGENDEYGTLAQLDALALHAPQTQRLAIAHCGHAPWKERAEIVTPSIAEFVARL